MTTPYRATWRGIAVMVVAEWRAWRTGTPSAVCDVIGEGDYRRRVVVPLAEVCL